ncbi:restriction endonuclease subunit S [Micromonospora sp. NBC_01739]|uniref:restriction endonuclease subunit S n=1 Tax=Micromonospora sp. NBC_01739 TaxID=2975985 RepID=UPI002E0EF001|nr:restriction endonuclease subunit S [Micromonospora sp. NBC_01739]
MTGPLWGALPDGWMAGQVKNAATVTLGKMLQSNDSGNDMRAPYMRAANVQPDGVLALDDVKEMWFGEAELEQLSIRAGDVVVVEGGQGGFGRAAYVDEDLPGWGFQNSINRLRPFGDFDGRFIAFYLIALRASGFVRAYSNVVSMPHLTAEKLARIPMPLPPLEEQRAIADYLDGETVRIDTLIEEQRRLVEMLRKRRADLISHAVLDATSERTQLRRLVDVIDCAHVTAEFVDDDRRYPVASIRECQAATVDLSACNYTTAEFFEHLRAGSRAPRAGDLLFIRNVSVGLVSVVTSDLPKFAIGQETVLLRRKSDVHPSFLRYALLGAEARHAIEQAMIGSTFRRINVSAIRSLPVPAPPINEQHRIAMHLDRQIAKIDSMIEETERFVELTRERRSALITAAVTGQIDVREMA